MSLDHSGVGHFMKDLQVIVGTSDIAFQLTGISWSYESLFTRSVADEIRGTLLMCRQIDCLSWQVL